MLTQKQKQELLFRIAISPNTELYTSQWWYSDIDILDVTFAKNILDILNHELEEAFSAFTGQDREEKISIYIHNAKNFLRAGVSTVEDREKKQEDLVAEDILHTIT